MRHALEIAEQVLGTQHPNIATALSNLASLLLATNRLEEAEPLLRRAIDIQEKAAYLSNLAQLLQGTNRPGEAEPLMRRAVEIYEESLGSDHPGTQIGQRNLAGLLADIETQSNPGSGPSEETGPED